MKEQSSARVIEKTMLTVEEVAERWGVHRQTVYGMIEKKEIKVVRIGRLVKISRSHIEFIEENGSSRQAG